jgi:uncharacterized protein
VSSQVELLLIVQERDRKIQRMEREIDDLPKRKALIEAQLDSHKRAVQEAEEVLRKGGLQQKELESEIDECKAKITKFRQQQFEVKNNDDYRALENQIEATNKAIAEIEERELVVMEAVEQAEQVRDEKSQELADEQKLVDVELGKFQERIANVERELEETRALRKRDAEAVDPEWLSRYDRIFQHVGDYALVEVDENHTCGGCHMKIPPQAVHDARKLDSMTPCMYCGRLLYSLP